MALLDSYIEKNKNALGKGAAQTVETPIAETAQTGSVAPTLSNANPPASATGATNVQSYLKKTLEGQNPIVQNAQATQNTASAVQKYLAGKTARNTSAQAGFDPGTLQYQRTQDRATAAADQANLAGQNQVDALTRDVSQQALADKSALDAAAIQSVQDPKARNYLQGVLASGGDVQAALAGMYENGVLKPEYSSGTPGEILRREAEDIIKNTYPDLVPGSPEFEAAVNKRLQDADRATTGPIKAEVTAAELADIQRIAKSGGTLTPEQLQILSENTTQVANSALPSNAEQIQAAMSKDPFVKLEDGNVYQIQDYYQQTRWDRSRSAGVDNRHSDWTVLKDVNTGNTVYVRSDGVKLDYKPPAAPTGAKITYSVANGRWETEAGKVYDPATQKWVSPGRTDG